MHCKTIFNGGGVWTQCILVHSNVANGQIWFCALHDQRMRWCSFSNPNFFFCIFSQKSSFKGVCFIIISFFICEYSCICSCLEWLVMRIYISVFVNLYICYLNCTYILECVICSINHLRCAAVYKQYKKVYLICAKLLQWIIIYFSIFFYFWRKVLSMKSKNNIYHLSWCQFYFEFDSLIWNYFCEE